MQSKEECWFQYKAYSNAYIMLLLQLQKLHDIYQGGYN